MLNASKLLLANDQVYIHLKKANWKVFSAVLAKQAPKSINKLIAYKQ